jgi:antitoxin HicB
MIYLLTVEKDDNGTFLVTSPDFPEVTTFAESKDKIEQRGLAAIEEAIAARMADGQAIPFGLSERDAMRRRGAKVQLPLMAHLKVGLFLTLKEKQMTRADLVRRLEWNRESVDRLFRLDHASRIDQIESAYKALDTEIEVRLVPH